MARDEEDIAGVMDVRVASASFTPSDNYLINCSSPSNSSVFNRVISADQSITRIWQRLEIGQLPEKKLEAFVGDDRPLEAEVFDIFWGFDGGEGAYAGVAVGEGRLLGVEGELEDGLGGVGGGGYGATAFDDSDPFSYEHQMMAADRLFS
ncbi:hypothetical protein ACFX14_035877 [Malus domestica]